MTPPLFSVIVPVYNTRRYLDECLDSLKAQTFRNWECICVDDGSTDGSGDALDGFAARDGRFRIIHKSNGGVGSARNAALDAATGEWLVFLDSDDVLHPGMMEICSAAIRRFPGCDIVRFNAVYRNGEQRIDWNGRQSPEDRHIDIAGRIPPDVMDKPFWSGIYRRVKTGVIRFPAYIVGEDWVWLSAAYAASAGIAEINASLYGYRQRAGSAMNSSMTEVKLKSHIAWRIDTARIWNSAGVRTSASLARRAWLNCTEMFAAIFFSDDAASSRREVWSAWLAALRELAGMEIASRWCKSASRMVFATKSRFLAWLFFFLPYWLKSRGFHR